MVRFWVFIAVFDEDLNLKTAVDRLIVGMHILLREQVAYRLSAHLHPRQKRGKCILELAQLRFFRLNVK